jgi:hypothetical protein
MLIALYRIAWGVSTEAGDFALAGWISRNSFCLMKLRATHHAIIIIPRAPFQVVVSGENPVRIEPNRRAERV